MQMGARGGTRHGTEVRGRITRIAHPQALNALLQTIDEGLGQLGHHDQTLGRDARLSAVVKPPQHRCVGGRIQVGVSQHHERVGAAELQQAALEVPGGKSGHRLPRGRRSGERDHRHRRMGDHGLEVADIGQ